MGRGIGALSLSPAPARFSYHFLLYDYSGAWNRLISAMLTRNLHVHRSFWYIFLPSRALREENVKCANATFYWSHDYWSFWSTRIQHQENSPRLMKIWGSWMNCNEAWKNASSLHKWRLLYCSVVLASNMGSFNNSDGDGQLFTSHFLAHFIVVTLRPRREICVRKVWKTQIDDNYFFSFWTSIWSLWIQLQIHLHLSF